MKPGLTGAWQVSAIGKKEAQSCEDRNALEAKFVKERGGVMKDLALLVKTVPAFFKGHDGEYLSCSFRHHDTERKNNVKKEMENGPD